MGLDTGEGCLNDGVAVLRGLVIVIESVIESLTPGGLVEGRVLSAILLKKFVAAAPERNSEARYSAALDARPRNG